MISISFDLRLQIAVARARLVARTDFRRAVALLIAAKVRIESAIAYVAKLCGAFSLASAQVA